MGRVWVGWAGVVGVLLMLWMGLGFFGTPALQYGLPVIALTIGALLLPNGELWWKGLCLLGGVVIAMIGFLLGAGVFPDNAFGYTVFPELESFAQFVTPEVVTSRVEDRLAKAAKSDRPFFWHVFYSCNHLPYRSPEPYCSLFTDPAYQGKTKPASISTS